MGVCGLHDAVDAGAVLGAAPKFLSRAGRLSKLDVEGSTNSSCSGLTSPKAVVDLEGGPTWSCLVLDRVPLRERFAISLDAGNKSLAGSGPREEKGRPFPIIGDRDLPFLELNLVRL
mmetsp:Transcript_46470/g.72739  ORF Transcript_46470/g.72739 Transcript_46470/m.72739 type:complete len:117 (+) Transcript_46470:1326-1676(+)